MDANKLSSLSQTGTDEKIGEFWDNHDFTDFDTDVPDVKFEITPAVPIEVDLFSEIEQQARQRGVKVETLVLTSGYGKNFLNKRLSDQPVLMKLILTLTLMEA